MMRRIVAAAYANTVTGYGIHTHKIVIGPQSAFTTGTPAGSNKTIWPQGSDWRMTGGSAYNDGNAASGTAGGSKYCRLYSNM